MPSLPASRRYQGEGAPAARNQWSCPTCGAEGWAQNAHAAMTAGVRHYTQTHDRARFFGARGRGSAAGFRTPPEGESGPTIQDHLADNEEVTDDAD